MDEFKNIPKKYHPKGFELLYEDRDLIIGNKVAGLLSVRAKWEKEKTVHHALNLYVRKGNSKSHKCVFVVHRLDQETSGVLMFAKSAFVQHQMKDNWKDVAKIYLAIVSGKVIKKQDTITSYLEEDEEYHVHSAKQNPKGKLAKTQYEVIAQTEKISLLRINLITGRKNQIRVHMAQLGHPVVGDQKYGNVNKNQKHLLLHSSSIEFKHPINEKRIKIQADIPEHFFKAFAFDYKSIC